MDYTEFLWPNIRNELTSNEGYTTPSRTEGTPRKDKGRLLVVLETQAPVQPVIMSKGCYVNPVNKSFL